MKEKIQKRIRDGIADGKDREAALSLVDSYFAADDFNERRKISGELFLYEKKCMPRFSSECDVLIMSVGMQKEPVILSIISTRPKRVFLLHTVGSRPTAEMVMRDYDVGLLDINFKAYEVGEVDAAYNYRLLKDIVVKELGDDERIFVDPTGGRKTMGALLATFAFFYRIPMIYLRADECKNRAVPFTGVVCEIENPYTYFGDIELSILEKHFDNYGFDAAIVVCDELLNTVRDRALHTEFLVVKEFIELYRDWDAFFHSRHYVNKADRDESNNLAKRLSGILRMIERFGLEFVDNDAVEGNIEFLEGIELKWRPGMNLCDKYRLVDLLCNADRRAEQGKFDDATARLYRCLEMCSTIRLEEVGLKDVARPDYQGFADANGLSMDDVAKVFNADGRWLPDMLALNQQMTLLGLLNEPVVSIYRGMQEGEDSLMNRRNRSVLAHGTNSISKKDFNIFRSRAVSIINNITGKKEFDLLLNQAIFPKISFR